MSTSIIPDVKIYDNMLSTYVDEADYEISYVGDLTQPGHKSIIAHGQRNYGGSLTGKFEIYVNIKDSTITLDESSFTYTGSQIIPTISVTSHDKLIVQKYGDYTAYTLKYDNNINAGTASVTVTSSCEQGGSRKLTYQINPVTLVESNVKDFKDAYEYTGRSITQTDMTIVFNSRVLTSGRDYEVSYSNNVNVGYATLSVIGKGNFTNTVDLTFKIFGNLQRATIIGTKTYNYTGDPIKPDDVQVSCYGSVLTQGTDYELYYPGTDYIMPGKKELIASGGIGLYENNCTFEYEIIGDLSQAELRDFKNIVEYTGSQAFPEGYTIVFHEMTLTEGQDYKVILDESGDYITVGTKKFTLQGIGSFNGSIEVKYYILSKTATALVKNDGTVSINEWTGHLTRDMILNAEWEN